MPFHCFFQIFYEILLSNILRKCKLGLFGRMYKIVNVFFRKEILLKITKKVNWPRWPLKKSSFSLKASPDKSFDNCLQISILLLLFFTSIWHSFFKKERKYVFKGLRYGLARKGQLVKTIFLSDTYFEILRSCVWKYLWPLIVEIIYKVKARFFFSNNKSKIIG